MTAVVRADGLVKEFPGGRKAVDGLSFEVPDRGVFGLLGPNGAGKTTTLRVLLGLATPTSGSAELLGRRLGSSDYRGSLSRTGSLIEEPAHWRTLTARRNLEIHARYLHLDDAPKRIDGVLDVVGLARRAGDRVKTYSQGMRQRLGIAVALLPQPDLVILDEPTNGLDPAGIVEMRDLMRRLPESGTTVLLSSHLLGEVEMICDEVAILDRGRLVTAGPTSDILAAHGTVAFEVHVDPADLDRAIAALADAGLPAAAVTDHTIAVTALEGVTGRHVSWTLSQAGVWLEELHRNVPSLEDVFLSLTGGDGAVS